MISGLTIIIPVYNEFDNLLRVEKEMVDYLVKTSTPSSILFINDGSTDKSQELIEAICKRRTLFNYIELDKNYGLSTAIKVGFDHTVTKLVGYIDADLQTSPQDFNLLLKYTKDYQLVTGVRTIRQDSFSKKLISKIANSLRRTFTRDGVIDTGCPLKIMHVNYAKRIPMFRGLHRFLPAMILLQNGDVKQVPVRHFPRISGKTNFNLKNRFISPILDCFAYLWIKHRYIEYRIKNRS